MGFKNVWFQKCYMEKFIENKFVWVRQLRREYCEKNVSKKRLGIRACNEIFLHKNFKFCSEIVLKKNTILIWISNSISITNDLN
jgi:hypothetical protein